MIWKTYYDDRSLRSCFVILKASKAVDGDRNSDYDAGSCSHSQEITPVWWMVDLEETVTITNVFITSRDQGGKPE